MSKLVWDKTGERFYETGVDHGVLYPLSTTGEYETGVAWNGLSSVSENPSGAEANDIYADNIKYLSLMSAEDFGLTIEAYTYPDEWAECDGSASPATGVIIGQQTRKAFGFCYRTKVGNDVNADLGYKLHLIYNCKASPSDRSYNTINDSPEAISFSWTITTTPVETGIANMKPSAQITIDSAKIAAAGLTSKLTELEGILYGTDADGSNEGTTPRFPSMSEVVSMFQEQPEPPVSHTATINPASATIAPEGTETLAVKFDGVAYTGEVTWTSSDSTIATVEASVGSEAATAIVTAAADKTGDVTITATFTVDTVEYTPTASITVSSEQQGEG